VPAGAVAALAAGFASGLAFAAGLPEVVEPAAAVALGGAGLVGAASGFAGAVGLSLGG